MFRFEHPYYLYLLLALIPLSMLFIGFMLWRKKAIKRFGKDSLVVQLIPNAAKAKHTLKFILIVFGLTFIILGFANPQIGTKYEKVERKGIDIIIAFDVSKSMLAKDITPSRLLKAKQLVSNLIDKMANDRIGIIVFAGNAYLQMPLTVDYSAGKMYLQTISTDMVPTQGTAIGDAVRLAINSFNQEENKHKALVVITDGENHEGDAIEAIKQAKEQGIIVYTIGVGTAKGAPISEGKNNTYKKDSDGNIVLTKLNDKMLINMASLGNGKYFNIQEKNIETAIIDDISKLEGKLFDEKMFTEYDDKFQIFLALGFLFLLSEFSLSERKSVWFEKLKSLFK